MKKPTKGLTTKKAIMAGAAVISLSAGVAMDANAASGTGAMSAILLTPINVSGNQNLHFGSFTADTAGAGGAIIVDTAGARALSGGTGAGDVTLVTGAGLESEGQITITADTGINIDMSIAAGTVPANTLGGEAVAAGYYIGLIATPVTASTRMTVGNFIIGTPTTPGDIGGGATAGLGAGDSITGFRLTGASAVFPLGGTLLVPAGNTPGTYTGTYDLVANYQ
jgi:hypothetical protein